MDTKEIFYLVSSLVLLISAIVLVVVILIQSNSSKGLSGAIAGGSDTFYGRNKGKSIDKKLMIVTIVLAAAFAFLSLGIFAIQSNTTYQDYLNDIFGYDIFAPSTDTSSGPVLEEEETISSDNTTSDDGSNQ